ncbi:tetratricopeptide repeat protein 22-like [Amphiura filiformis]|uniref:tetratricopeptide repeat protein 22-like n=1 Tax=Amphiura filiformis TaxID=82378 RepID=UPI003B227981
MIAVLHYRLDEVHEATDILEKTLKEDPHNLNVLQDLIDIYQRDFRNEDKVECERRLKLVMDKIDTEEISETVHIFARCIAGKGFAWGFDIHPDSRETSRLDASIALYEQAVSVSGDKVDVKEKQDWLYYLALGYIRQNNIKRVSKDRVLYLKVFDKVLKCLTPNIESDDQQRRSASWCLLGSLFAQKPYNATGIPETIKNTELKAFWFHPEKCYLRALEIESRNWDAHNQLAHLYYKQGKEEEGLELLDKSLKINHGTSNSYALHIRAQIHLHVFNRQLQRKLQKKGPPPDRKHLHEAKTDLILCIQYNPYVLDMVHLSEIHHKLAWNEELSSYENKGLNEALRWCTKAENCQDGATRPDVHQRRALILQDLGDIDDAIKCFMQAMDCEQSSGNRNFVFMVKAMLKRYHNTEIKPKYMLHELAYWVVQGVKKYSNCKLGSFVTGYPEEMLDVGELMFESGKQRQIEVVRRVVKAFKDKKVAVDSARLNVLDQDTTDYAFKVTSAESKASYVQTTDAYSSSMQSPSLTSREFEENVDLTAAETLTQMSISAVSDLGSLDSEESSNGSLPIYRHSKNQHSTDDQGNAIRRSKSPLLSSDKTNQPDFSAGATSGCSDGHNCPAPLIKIQSSDITSGIKEKESFQGHSDESSQSRMLQTAIPDNLQVGIPPFKAFHTGFKYDFFVVFDTQSAEIRDWVYYHLRSQLEVGQYALKGCIQERDFETNTPFLTQTVKSTIEGSAKILLVISNGFLENNFCKEASELALQTQHIHKAILVMINDISLPSAMKPLPLVGATNVINWKQLSEFLFQ